MKTHNLLFLCFFSAFWDVFTPVTIFQRAKGTDFQIRWFFPTPGNTKFFCRRECTDDNILVKTEDNKTQSGRYSSEYIQKYTGGYLTVTIAKLTKNDTGRYRLGVGGPLSPNSPGEFEIRVLDGPQGGNKIHVEPEGEEATDTCFFNFPKMKMFFCKNECSKGNILIETSDNETQSGRYRIAYKKDSVVNASVLRVTVGNLNKSDSGRYVCGLGESLSSASFQTFEINVTDAIAQPTSTLRPLSSLPSSSSSSSIPRTETVSSAPNKTTKQFTVSSPDSHPVSGLPVIICVIALLVVVVFLVTYRLKKNRNSVNRNHEEIQTYSTQKDAEDELSSNLYV